ncbi:hypothetical protein [Lutibacter citreus]|uniref:hypothetical protein n=1 Tax=Lutibacter citreus TaxID=2138210 RepID=UPI000DBE55BF|nr:hypothetical protein [Lutibacter citreus]
MNIKIGFILLFVFLFECVSAQEYRNIQTYKKVSNSKVLQSGCWLKKDRKRQTEVWENANIFNLAAENGNLKYTSISQICDFYKWFDNAIKVKGHEINGVGIASIAAKQLSNMDNGFIRVFIVRNKEIVLFANEGSKKVLAFGFPLLKEVYFSEDLIIGEKAKIWDIKNGTYEQCQVLEPLYNRLSIKALYRLERIAKGKGIFNLAVPNELKFEGDIDNCHSRFEHGKNKLLPYYLSKRNN